MRNFGSLFCIIELNKPKQKNTFDFRTSWIFSFLGEFLHSFWNKMNVKIKLN